SAGNFSFKVQLSEGSNALRVRATDHFGQQLIQSYTVALDTHAPTVNITNPASGLMTNHNITVSGQVSDDLSGVASLQEAIDNGSFANASFDAAGAFHFDTRFALDGTEDGRHTIHMQATDNAGNVSVAFDLSFTLSTPSKRDTAPPVVTIRS